VVINYAKKFGGLIRSLILTVLIVTAPIYLAVNILGNHNAQAETDKSGIETIIKIDATATVAKLSEVAKPTPKQTETPTAGTTSQTSTAYYAPTRVSTPTPAPGRYISIPAIGVSAHLINLGLTASGAVDAPTNLYDAGWYTGSVAPGNPGASFIDGHSPGVFGRLSALGAGSIITVGWDGQIYNYRVTSVQIVALDQVNMGMAVYGIVGGGNQGLNIMTCYGTYLPAKGTYSHRVIVYSVRV